jgi:hypothetical protein
MERKKIGIFIDYVLRVPDFKECYTKMKQEIITGMTSAEPGVSSGQSEYVDNKKDTSGRDFWVGLHKTDPKAYAFYETKASPAENFGPDFDLTYRKYFYNNEHRLKFLENWSYPLFAQNASIKKEDLNLINICQSQLCDVILLDRIPHIRKISNTFALLSKLGLFVKEVRFINREEDVAELSKEMLDVYDPITDPSKVLSSKEKGQSKNFLNWFMELEKNK